MPSISCVVKLSAALALLLRDTFHLIMTCNKVDNYAEFGRELDSWFHVQGYFWIDSSFHSSSRSRADDPVHLNQTY